eukprot:GGOE01010393.1.p1 GENE.GGOE01010393.1~~GGOE01010393.1.p1  ORF type:complete len:102 (-),score=9.54 GGOE01010393.1:656-961(-)
MSCCSGDELPSLGGSLDPPFEDSSTVPTGAHPLLPPPHLATSVTCTGATEMGLRPQTFMPPPGDFWPCPPCAISAEVQKKISFPPRCLPLSAADCNLFNTD